MNVKKIDKAQDIETPLRVFEAFAGIGSQRKALFNNKTNFEVIGLAEWYLPAIISYEAIHHNFSPKSINYKMSRDKMIDLLEGVPLSLDSKTLVKSSYWKRKHLDEIRMYYSAVKASKKHNNIFDVRTLYKNGLKNIDLLTYSFPCQDLSQQGKQSGMSKNKNTRSGLLWEIEKALDHTNKEDLPQYLLMENVMALVYKKNQRDLNKWMRKLESLGYRNDLQVLNSSDFGSPQARRRTFMLSSLNKKILLPLKNNKKRKNIKSILNKEVNKNDYMPALLKYDLTKFKKTRSLIKKASLTNYSSFNSETYVYDKNFKGPTLTASGANSRIKIREGKQIRKINAEEAYRYMGFKTSDFNKVDRLNFINETKKIFTCGNSISVEVLEAIMNVIDKDFKENNEK